MDATIAAFPVTAWYKLFRAATTTVNTSELGPLNSVYVGFTLSKASPFSAKFIVQIQVEEAGKTVGLVEGSVLTNFPVFNSSLPIPCYVVDNLVECRNVGAFLNEGSEYFIAMKLFYPQTASASLSNFGLIKILSDTDLGR